MKNSFSFLHRSGRSRRFAALAVFVFCAGLATPFIVVVKGYDAVAAQIPTVSIDNFQFSPATITVSVGASVTWINQDGDVHSIAADGTPPAFKSAGLDTGDKFFFTFAKPGTYAYHCSLHPHMTGKIIVQ